MKGVNRTNAIIPYSYGNGTKEITFIYTVHLGDSVDGLDVIQIDFSQGNISSRFGTGLVSQTVPPLGRGFRYMSSSPGSLSSTFSIGISSFLASVVNVTSPNASAIYTAGDEIYVDVTFSLPVQVTNPELLTLSLATDLFSRSTPFLAQINRGQTLRFIYDVQLLDTVTVLETTGTSALVLNGAEIYVVAGTVNLDANIVLPTPYTTNSISGTKTIAVNTNAPVVAYVKVASANGNYTAGDTIQLQVVFSTNVFVQGTPRIALKNNPRVLDINVISAPYLPELSYRRSFPGGVAQVILNLVTNVALTNGDQIILTLPRLFILDSNVTSPRQTYVDLFGAMAATLNGVWDDADKKLVLTANGTIARFTNMEILIEGRSSFFVSELGLGAPYQETVSFIASSLDSSPSNSVQISTIESVGYTNVTMSVSPVVYDEGVMISFLISFPEALLFNDRFRLYIPGFVSNQSSLNFDTGVMFVNNTELEYAFYQNSSSILFTVVGSTSGFKISSFSIALGSFLGLQLPHGGIDSSTVSVSISSSSNGVIEFLPVSNITRVCSAPADGSINVYYSNFLAGSSSAVRFTFVSGLFGLSVGDSVEFTLSQLSTLGLSAFTVPFTSLSGTYKSSFVVSVTGSVVKFSVAVALPANVDIVVTVAKSVGLLTPTTGIQTQLSSSFQFRVVSASCAMSKARKIPYASKSQIIYISSGSVVLNPLIDSFGALTGMNIKMIVASPGVRAGDILRITTPGFTRSISYNRFNSSVSSTANVTTLFNRRVSRLEFTLNEDFAGGPSSPFEVNISRGALLYLPKSSLSSTAFQLSIYSKTYGSLSSYTLSTSCIGFCTSSITFSSVFTSDPSTLTVSFSYSQAIAAGSSLSLRLVGFETPSSLAVYQGSTLLVSQVDGIANVNFTTASAINAFSAVNFTVGYLELSESALTSLSAHLYFSDPTLGGIASVALPCPDVYQFPYFIESNFTVYTTNLDEFILNFRLPSGRELYAPDFIDINLKDFIYFGTNISRDISDNLNVLDTLGSYYDASSERLRLFLQTKVDSTMHLVITVSNFHLPPAGLVENSTDVLYAIGFDATTNVVTDYLMFGTVSEIIKISGESVSFVLMGNNSAVVDSISLAFSLTSRLALGEQVHLYLPRVEAYQASTSVFALGVSGNVLATAKWNDTEKLITMTMLELSPLTFSVTFNATNAGGLKVSSAGIPYGSLFSMQAIDFAGNSIANATNILPCVGICDLVLIPSSRNPGRSSALGINMTLGEVIFQPGDVLSLTLAGFKSSSKDPMDIMCSSQDMITTSVSMTLNWYDNSATLQLYYNHTQSSISGPKALSSLYCRISQNFNLQLPKEGIRSSDFFSGNLSLDSHGGVTSYTSSTVRSQVVGSAIESSISISPQQSNVAVSMTFALILRDPLEVGDKVYIYLPDFGVPSRAIQVFPSNNVSLRVVGFSAESNPEVNPDDSIYFNNSISSIRVELLSALAAEQLLEFSVDTDAQIKSPVRGVFGPPLPWFSIASASSPVSGITFQNITKIGTLSPNSYRMYDVSNSTTELYQVLVNFTLFCPFLQNDTLLINIPNLTPATNNYNVTLVHFNSSRQLQVDFGVRWVSRNSSTLEIALNDGYVTSGQLSFLVRFIGFTRSEDVIYQNDDRLFYESTSAMCPVANSSFETSNAHFVASATAALVPFGDDGRQVYVSFTFKPIVDILAGDVLVLHLNKVAFAGSCPGSICNVPLNSTQRSLLSTATIIQENNASRLLFTFNRDVSGYHTIKLNTLSLTNTSFLSTEYVVTSSDITYFMERNTTDTSTNITTSSVLFNGVVQSLVLEPYLLQSSIVIANPVTGQVSEVTISFQFSGVIGTTFAISLSLPGFSLPSSSASKWIYASADSTVQFSVEWFAATQILKLTPLLNIAGLRLISVEIPSSYGLTLPSQGIPSLGQEFTLSLSRLGQSIFKGIVDEITNVPYISYSKISFLSCDYEDSFNFGGDYHAFQLAPGYEITRADIGSLIDINGTVYVITDLTLDDNVMYVKEQYTGPEVFLAAPHIQLSSPPYRYANYVNGSNTNTLIFEYVVARGDQSDFLSLYPLVTSIDLNGGQLYRSSQKPKLAAILSIALFQDGMGKVVNTDVPRIERIYTTSPKGSYAAGQLLDIWVQFDYDVVLVPDDSLPVPELILYIENSGYGYAKYHQGSKTSQLLFLYEVRSEDYQLNVTHSILINDAPIYEPLRVITGNNPVSLFRKAVDPFLDVDISINGSRFEFPSPQRWIGAVAQVVSRRVSSGSSLNTASYTAGDVVIIEVTFDIPVTVSSFAPTLPYILLDVGNGNSGIAEFSGVVSTTTLAFTYRFTVDDSVPHGLYLTCQCEDFLQRTFIRVSNDSSIVSDSSNIPAALLIARNATPAELLLDATITVDNASPEVVAIGTNATSGMYAPGSSIIISVTYNAPVMVVGLITLNLRGQSSVCRAGFFDGNGTSTLSFLYHTSVESGSARMECTSAQAIDTSLGQVYKLSQVASILATNTLPAPGEPDALGRERSVIIDTTSASLVSAQVLRSGTGSTNPLLSTKQLPFNSPRFTYDEIFQRCACDALNENPDDSAIFTSLIDSVNAKYASLNSTYDDDVYDYQRILLSAIYAPAIESLPSSVRKCFNWWKGFDISDQIQISLKFNRAVDVSDGLLTVGTALANNIALSTKHSTTFTLSVSTLQRPSMDGFFVFFSGGYLSSCLPQSVDRDQLATALATMPNLKIYQPEISNPTEDTSDLVSFTISFQRDVDLQLLADDDVSDICATGASYDSVSLTRDTTEVIFNYPINGGSSVLLRVNDSLPAGYHSVNFSGPLLTAFGAEKDSFTARQLSSYGIRNGSLSVISNNIGRVVFSSLHFGSFEPRANSYFRFELCSTVAFAVDDTITLYLPQFNDTDQSSFSNTSIVWAAWDARNSSIVFKFLQNSTCVGTPNVPVNYEITLRRQGVYRDDPSFLYSINSRTVGQLYDQRFDSVSPVGLATLSVTFNDTRPYMSTEISMLFDTMLDLHAGNDTIIVRFPGFYAADIKATDIYVTGSLNGLIEARWSNVSSSLYLSPLDLIPAGRYRFTVQSAIYPITVGSLGISLQDPPTIQVIDSQWAMDPTVLQSFPLVYGYSGASVVFSVNTSYFLQDITFSIEFAQNVIGPADIVVIMPAINNLDGFFYVSNDKGDLAYDTATWFDFNHSWVLHSNAGWDKDVPLSLTVANLSTFFVNERGVIAGINSGVFFAVNGFNGHINTTRVAVDRSIPVMSQANLALVKSEADAFYTGSETLSISFKTSTYPTLIDKFRFRFSDFPVNFSAASIDNVCYYIETWYVDEMNRTVLDVGLSNGSTTCFYRRVRQVSLQITNIVEISSQRALRQYGEPYAQYTWITPNFAPEFSNFQEATWVGLYTSAVTFSNPYYGEASNCNIKLLTSTKLLASDLIVLKIPGLNATWTTGWLLDQYQRSWKVTLGSSTLTLYVPTSLLRTSLSFQLSGNQTVILPTAGISFNGSADYTVTLHSSSASKTLTPQKIRFITPVGTVQSASLHVTREMGDFDDFSSLVLNLVTLNPLFAGDIITLSFTNVEFTHPSVLPLDDSMYGLYEILTTGPNGIKIVVFDQQLTTSLQIVVKPTTFVKIDTDNVCSNSAGCMASMSIVSFSNPVHNIAVEVQGGFLLAEQTKLLISYRDKYDRLNETFNVTVVGNSLFNSSDNILGFTFNVTLQSFLSSSAYILLDVSNLLNVSFLSPHSLIRTNEVTSETWNVSWYNGTSFLLQPVVNATSGFYSLDFKSEDFHLLRGIIFENSVKVQYTLFDGDYISDQSHVGYVDAWGLRSVAISWSNPVAGEESGLDVTVSAVTPFRNGDVVRITLPAVTKENVTMLARANFVGFVEWDSSSKQLILSVESGKYSELSVELPAVNKFIVPVSGIASTVNVPSVDVNVTVRQLYYATTNLIDYARIAPRVFSNVSFSPRIAYEWSTVSLTLTSSNLALQAGDIVSLRLPQFSSFETSLSVVDTVSAQWTASWSGCQERVSLTINDSLLLSSLSVDIGLLRLPPFGVSDSVVQGIEVDIFSSDYDYVEVTMSSVQRVGYVSSSALSWSPAQLQTSNALTLSFALSLPLDIGDVVTVKLPGLNFSHCDVDILPSGVFSVSFNNSVDHIQMVATAAANVNEAFALNTSACVHFSDRGFPEPQHQFVDYVIAVETDKYGVIGDTPINDLHAVGIKFATIHYTVMDIEKPLQLRLELELSTKLVKGDMITVYLPTLNYTSYDADHTVSLVIQGDLGDNSYASLFDGSYYTSTGKVVLTCIDEEIPLRPFNVFIGTANDITLGVNVSAPHFISAEISSLGSVAKVPLTVNPSTFPALRNARLEITSCGTDQKCQYSFHFETVEDLPANSAIALESPSWTLLPNASVAIVGVANDALLDIVWRDADTFEQLVIPAQQWTTANTGYDWTAADSAVVAVDKDIAVAIPLSNSAVASSDIPRILRCEFVNWTDNAIYPTEDAVLSMIFTLPVTVVTSIDATPKLLLNTGEAANYVSGSGSDTLIFRYTPLHPTTVETLAVAGPSALELLSAGLVFSDKRPTILANLTMSPPYELYQTDSGYRQSLSVTQLSEAPIKSVFAYSRNTSYGSGDILDVSVEFIRSVVVSGAPQLLLHYAGNPIDGSPDKGYALEFVNVSYVQYLDFEVTGDFAIIYQNHSSPCVSSSNRSAIYETITHLPGLEWSLPLVMTRIINDDIALQYKLRFLGIAPFLLRVETVYCDLRATVSVTMDQNMLDQAIFRTEIKARDPSGNLTYYNESSLRTANFSTDSFSLALAGFYRNVNLTLPLPAVELAVVDNQAPFVSNVSSAFYFEERRPAESGDTVRIMVTFTDSVVLRGDIFLVIAVSNLVDNTVNQPRVLPMVGVFANQLTFDYIVELGDISDRLTAVSLQAGFNATVLKYSRLPAIEANLTLPAMNSTSNLYGSMVSVNATNLPRILRVYNLDGSRIATAGTTVRVGILFSSAINITSYSNLTAEAPYLILTSPEGGHLKFAAGSGSSLLEFTYKVKSTDASGNLTFPFLLQGGFAQDLLGHTFRNISEGVEYTVEYLLLNTIAPHVVKVDCTAPDGMYYPGQILDVFVEFNEAVLLLPPTSGEFVLPLLELFIPTQIRPNIFATYWYGNGTKQLHYRFMIPLPNVNALPHLPFQLNYAGIIAMKRYLFGSRITSVSPDPETDVNDLLPILDQSYLIDARNIYVSLTLAAIDSVSIQKNGTYTVGDTLRVAVNFTQPVMFFNPAPLLLLQMGSDRNVTAIYISGNDTSTLWFEYTIKVGDSIVQLDYIDTEYSPYDSDDYIYSYPLVAFDDFQQGIFGRPECGIFMASDATLFGVPVPFPKPGSPGSISDTSAITVDTSIPRILLVTTVQPSGTYGYGIQLTVLVTFSWPVAVTSCPRLTFVIENTLRFATYTGGSGTDTLMFEFVILPTDYRLEYDYYSASSFELFACPGSNTAGWVRRYSQNPTLGANLTMPLVNYRPTVASPSSILSSGINITLGGVSSYPLLVGSSAAANTVFSFGDVVNFTVTWTLDVTARSTNQWIELTSATNNGSIYQLALYANRTSGQTLSYALLVGPYDQQNALSYTGPLGLRSTSNCAIVGVSTSRCAAQNLPTPYQFGDNLSPKNLSIASSLQRINLLSLEFEYPDEKNFFAFGDAITVLASFSGPVDVVGQPLLHVSLNSSVGFTLAYVDAVSNETLRFSRVVGQSGIFGTVECGRFCQFDVSNGLILRSTNFLPLVNVDVSLPEKTCEDANCVQIGTGVLDVVPQVVRVFSNASGVQTLNDTVSIFVEFSSPVIVRGTPAILLDLMNYPAARFIAVGSVYNGSLLTSDAAASVSGSISVTKKVLLFQHKITTLDITSALDYTNTSALIVPEIGADHSASQGEIFRYGIFSSSPAFTVPADLTLPVQGSANSLGVTSAVIIDQNRPNVLSITSTPTGTTTCGDVLTVRLIYNLPMILVSRVPQNTPATSQLTLSLAVTSKTTGAVVQRFNASFVSLVDNTLTFSAVVFAAYPMGTLTLGSSAPLYLGNYSLLSRFTRVPSPVVFDASLVASFAVDIVKILPAVLTVSSPNTTTAYSYGVGDVIYIDVTFNVPVRVDGGNATLVLSLNGVVREATFSHLKSSNLVMVFTYEVNGDDRSSLLTYRSIYSLKGDIYQISQCDVPVPADLTLPVPGTDESLSGCCPISIESTPPYVRALFPVKSQGSYGENDMLLVVARFSGPVVVFGSPLLLLSVGENRTGIANYTSISRCRSLFTDLTLELLSTDVPFVYTIQAEDAISNVVHASADAFVFSTSRDRILQASNNPAYDADTTLRAPGDLTKNAGLVSRQWKYRFFQSIDILLRDFEHPNPASLTVTINHQGTTGVLFQNCCNGDNPNSSPRSFGYSKNYYTSGTVSSVLAVEDSTSEKNGIDLLFSDTTVPNIAASRGRATQSSTLRAASLAVDGGFSPVVGDGSVTETVQETNPWWNLKFQSTSTPVQSIAIFERLPETWVPPVVQFTIKGLDRNPSGYFRLRISNFNSGNLSEIVTTSFIKVGASDTGVLKALAPSTILGNVQVEKRVLPLCIIEGNTLSSGLGCGDGIDYGYGAAYKLTFLDLLVADPDVEIVDFKYPGEPLQLNGTTLSEEEKEYLAQTYPVSLKVERLRSGFYRAIFKQYQGESPGEDTSLSNAWLTPFYVFLFNSTTSTISSNISTAKLQASWYKRYTAIDKTLIITLPRPYLVSQIRIQREGTGSLSLTEVAVYSTALRNLDDYQPRTNPVQATELGAMYTPNSPLRPLYSEIPYDGQWVVTISQPSQSSGSSTGQSGSLSEVVIVVTDMAGVVTAYYQDIYAVLDTLPRYGTLYTTEKGSLLGYTSWHEAFGLLFSQPILPDAARSIALGQCTGDIDSLCFQKTPGSRDFRVERTQQVTGDKPLTRTILRNERIVYYIPDPSFKGQDFFTYSTYAGFAVQQRDQTVSLVVQPCRLFLNRSSAFASASNATSIAFAYPQAKYDANVAFSAGSYWSEVSAGLCHCAPSALDIIADESACISSRASICSVLSSNSAGQNMLRGHFYDMCLSCYGYSVSGTLLEADATANDAGSCRTLTIRAASLLLLRGLCSSNTTQITSVVTAQNQYNTNKTDYYSYYSSQGIDVGREAVIPDECLITEDFITESSIMRRNYISAQHKPLV